MPAEIGRWSRWDHSVTARGSRGERFDDSSHHRRRDRSPTRPAEYALAVASSISALSWHASAVEASQQSVQDDGSSDEVTQTERAVFGQMTAHEVRSFLDSYVQRQLGSPISRVRFRAGRIDSVWGIDLDDGRAVVVKTHRLPMDLEAARTTRDALEVLSDAGYPCPTPLSGPDEIDGRVVTAETLLIGEMPDGRDPGNRRLLADGLARHIALLREWPDLAHRPVPDRRGASTRKGRGLSRTTPSWTSHRPTLATSGWTNTGSGPRCKFSTTVTLMKLSSGMQTGTPSSTKESWPEPLTGNWWLTRKQ